MEKFEYSMYVVAVGFFFQCLSPKKYWHIDRQCLQENQTAFIQKARKRTTTVCVKQRRLRQGQNKFLWLVNK